MRSLIFAALSLLCLASQAWAAVKVGPQFQVNTTTNGNEYNPSVAALKDGGFVVVWISFPPNASSVLYGQRYDLAGNTVAGVFTIAAIWVGVTSASVAGLRDGGFVVAWNTAGYGSYLTHYNAAGDISGERRAPYGGYNISVASLRDGGFVIAYESWKSGVPISVVFARRYTARGRPSGAVIEVAIAGYNAQAPVAVTGLQDGGFVVVWRSWDSSNSGVFGQRFSAAGAYVGNQFQMNTYSANNQDHPRVAGLRDGGFVAAWDSVGQDGRTPRLGVFARRYDNAGAPVADEVQINSSRRGDQLQASIAGLSHDGIVVSFTDNGGTIFIREYRSDHWSAQATPVGTIGDGGNSSVVAGLFNDGFVVIWVQDNSIFGQRYQ